MTADVKLLERLVRHQILNQRFAGGQIKAALPIIRQLAKDLRKRIQSAEATEFQMGRMVALERDIQALVATATGDIQGVLELEDFAVQEAEFTQKLLGASVSIDLAEGLDLDAIRAITTRRKLRLVSGDTVKNLTIPEMWDEFSEAAGRDAMRVVQAGVLESKTQQQMARGVAELVTTRSRRQAETVVRTAVNGIGGAARNEVYGANRDILEGERFLATLDSSTTYQCAGHDQSVHPLGRGPMPPLHFGCVLPDCDVTPSGAISYVTKRPFNGEVIVIRTLGNRELTVTGNHPVMTDRGFIPAKLLKQGDRVVSSLGTDSLRASSNDDQVESVIEDRFDALLSSGRMQPVPVPYAPEDFHGDVTEEEVGVVLVDSELSDAMVSTLAHQFVKRFLKVTGSRALVGESAGREFAEFVFSFYMAERCGVSFGGESSDLLRARIIHAGLLLLGPVAGLTPRINQQVIDDAGRDTKLFANADRTPARLPHADDHIGIEGFMSGLSTGVDAVLFGGSVADGAADASYAGDFRGLYPLTEELDTVSEVGRRSFSGHVFNLMCGDGVYSASGIITHNCRSIRVPVIKEEYRIATQGERASMDGPVSNQLTYGGFLRNQSREFQDDYLGPRRAELFRSGQIKIDQFTDDMGRTLTLDQLRQRYDLTME
ncbi:hypothetical protein R3F64_01295 [Halomonas sp. 5021]|uniref:hypothetical protein n=1 Tax=Halomonas sp. 5021 TaxID=3082156 RepID=UPI002FC5A7D5